MQRAKGCSLFCLSCHQRTKFSAHFNGNRQQMINHISTAIGIAFDRLTAPCESVALATSVCLPGFDGVCHSKSQRRQAFDTALPIKLASSQLAPPFVRTSTFVISPSLVHAAP